MKSGSFSTKSRIASFRHAFRGVVTLFRTQPNAWLHLIATATVVSAGLLFSVSAAEWLWLAAAIVVVWVAEAFNTAIEFLADAVSQERHPLIGKAKDVGAAAVLLASLGAAVIGVMVFWPHVRGLFGP